MVQEKEEKEVKVRQGCESCGSSQTYIRLNEGTRVCRSCGNVEELKEQVG